MNRLDFINKVGTFLRKIGIHVPHQDPTLFQDFLLGLDYSEEKGKPSLNDFKVGDFVENKVSGRQGIVYETGNYKEGIYFVKVRWPNNLNVVYCDNGFDGYLLKKI